MKRGLGMQLRRAALLTTLVALLLSAASLLAYEWHTYRRVWVDDLGTQAELIAGASEAALVFDDPKSAQQTLALLRQRPSIRYAAILQPGGRPFAEYLAPGAARSLPALDLRQREYRFEGAQLTLAYPVRHEGEWIGTVVLSAQHDIAGRIASYLGIEALAMAVALAIALVVSARLQRRVTQPLTRMTEVAREVIARRDWRLRAPGTDDADIALLVDAFNGMLAEVQARTAELEREMAERVRAEEDLRDADRRKDEFLATLGHELRNPMAPMTNAVALLRLDKDRAVNGRAVAILDRQLRHLSRLIDDLLDVSRITRGRLLLAHEPVELVALLRGVADTHASMAAARELQFHTRLPEPPCTVIGDSARLSQVFSNLLNNAFRYTPEGGSVELALQRAGDDFEVQVSDTGVGIPAPMQQRIFELFEQGDKRLERGNTGLGVGLTLARQLARLHGGDIGVRSEGEGRGACFTVRLPVARAQVPASAPNARRPGPAPLPQRVLVADDNVDFATSLQSLLVNAGHQVQVVHDGGAAFAAARDWHPDVAVLDIGMPVLNGYELARRLRADSRTRSIRLIAATGWGQASDKQAALEAGFDHHLAKPVRPEQLFELLAPPAAGPAQPKESSR
jgi:signal transduction histidine kinase/ActR/RegA family two-component response regulator